MIMSSQSVTVFLVEMIARAEAGVDYRPRTGAPCPACGHPAKIFKTRPWDGDSRIRYHRCQQSGCVLFSTRTTIKSVEIDE
jgi:hypothetical protein